MRMREEGGDQNRRRAPPGAAIVVNRGAAAGEPRLNAFKGVVDVGARRDNAT